MITIKNDLGPDKIPLIILSIVVIVVTVLYFRAETKYDNCSAIVATAERGEMYNKSIKPMVKLNGIWYSEGYYCVWTKGRDYCDIMNLDPSLGCVNETALHELTHELIDRDYEHFCGEE